MIDLRLAGLLTLACLSSACDERPGTQTEAVGLAGSTGARPQPIRYFLAALVRFDGAAACPFKVNALRPWCVALPRPPFAGAGKGKRHFEVVRTADRCTGDIAGLQCEEPHLFLDAQTLDTIWGARRFAAGGAFLIDRIASGRGDWIYRLYDGDGFNVKVSCFYPARGNPSAPPAGQLADADVRRLCEMDRLRYDSL